MSTHKTDIMKTGFILVWGALILALLICTRCYGLSNNSLKQELNIPYAKQAESAVTVPLQSNAIEPVNRDHLTNATENNTSGVEYSDYHNGEELLWLSAIIHAEARGECFEGKLAVGTVVMNRKDSQEYPNTVKDVIFDRRYGTQFSPIDDGSIYLIPSEESILAAKKCLAGYRTDPDILFFYNPSISDSTYFKDERTFEFRIGSHEFYS